MAGREGLNCWRLCLDYRHESGVVGVELSLAEGRRGPLKGLHDRLARWERREEKEMNDPSVCNARGWGMPARKGKTERDSPVI